MLHVGRSHERSLLFAINEDHDRKAPIVIHLVVDDAEVVGDVDEVAPVEVFADRVAGPGATAHRQRERQTVAETATIAERVRLVHQHAHDIGLSRKFTGMIRISGMDPDRMPQTGHVQDIPHDLLGLIPVRLGGLQQASNHAAAAWFDGRAEPTGALLPGLR